MRILNSTCKNHVNTTVHQNFDRKKVSFNLFSCEPPAAARVDSRPLYRWRRSRAEVSWGELSHGESLEPFSLNPPAVWISSYCKFLLKEALNWPRLPFQPLVLSI